MNILQQLLEGLVGGGMPTKGKKRASKKRPMPLQGLAQMDRPQVDIGTPMAPAAPQPFMSPIIGAFDPAANLQRGGTVYSPGEGPFIPSKRRPGNGSQYQ